MVETINGFKFTLKQSSHVERHLPCGDKLVRYIAQFFDSEGRFVAQGGSPVGKRAALANARRNLREQFDSYTNSTLNPIKLLS